MSYSLAPTDASFLVEAPRRFQQTFEVARSAQEVWADLTGPTPLNWCRALGQRGVQWTSSRPFGVGTTRRVRVLGGLLSLEERYVAWEEGRRKAFVGVTANLPLIKRLAEEYVVEPDGEAACRFRWTVAVEPTSVGRPGSPLNGAIFRSLFRDTERHYAEAAGPAAQPA